MDVDDAADESQVGKLQVVLLLGTSNGDGLFNDDFILVAFLADANLGVHRAEDGTRATPAAPWVALGRVMNERHRAIRRRLHLGTQRNHLGHVLGTVLLGTGRATRQRVDDNQNRREVADNRK